MFHTLDHKEIGDYSLHIGEAKQLPLSGWTGIRLYLINDREIRSTSPVIEGIYSKGGRDGIKPWFDGSFRESVVFEGEKGKGSSTLLLTDNFMGEELFETISSIIPRGGHLMISYEGEDPVHKETMRGLTTHVPPPTTPMGYLIFTGGFHYIKDWYLAEGGHEGPRKLWGEKARNREEEALYLGRTRESVEKFLEDTKAPPQERLIHHARERAFLLREMIR